MPISPSLQRVASLPAKPASAVPTPASEMATQTKQDIARNTSKPKEHDAAKLEGDIRRVIVQMCERAFWYIQAEREEKTLRTLGDELERSLSRGSDASNVPQILRLKVDGQQRAKQKCLDRMGAADGKLIGIARPLLESFRTSNVPQPAPASADTTLASVDAKLVSLQASTEAACKSAFLAMVEQEKARATDVEIRLSGAIQKLSQEFGQAKASCEALEQKQSPLEPKLERQTAACNADAKHDELKQALEKQMTANEALKRSHTALIQALDKQIVTTKTLEKRQDDLQRTVDEQQASKAIWDKKQKSLEKKLKEHTAVNEGLQKKHEELEKKLETLCQSRENDLAKLNIEKAAAEALAKRADHAQDAMQELSSKVTVMEKTYVKNKEVLEWMKGFDAIVAGSAKDIADFSRREVPDFIVGSKTRVRIHELQEKLGKLELDACETQEIRKSLSNVRDMVIILQARSEELKSNYGLALAKIESLKGTMSDVSSAREERENARASPPPVNTIVVATPVPTGDTFQLKVEESIERRLDVHHTALQDKLDTMGKRLGGFVDKERFQRETISDSVFKLQSVMDSLRQEMSAIREGPSRAQVHADSGVNENKSVFQQVATLEKVIKVLKNDLKAILQDVAAFRKEFNDNSAVTARTSRPTGRKLTLWTLTCWRLLTI